MGTAERGEGGGRSKWKMGGGRLRAPTQTEFLSQIGKEEELKIGEEDNQLRKGRKRNSSRKFQEISIFAKLLNVLSGNGIRKHPQRK